LTKSTIGATIPFSAGAGIMASQPIATRSDPYIDQVRRFNRFYTRRIGLLQEGLLRSPFSLTEVRVLYEIAHREKPTAAELCKELGLDAGYLSRLLSNFEKNGLLSRMPSKADARQSLLSLTAYGRRVFTPLERRQGEEVAAMLGKLAASEQKELVSSMLVIEKLLGKKSGCSTRYRIRLHRPGDMGWIVHRHGVLYSQEYGYDERFEALVAGIVSDFIQNFDATRERCWVAEKDGEVVGSIFLVKKSAQVAKLRLLLVEPSARGLGIGKRLVSECVHFAREAGYRKIVLWTQSELPAARHLYEQAGFRLVSKKPHRSWGRADLVAETWALKLR
jgi:DNA-binding MarR family transcriptional regulator/N-acetylglutamate synthase-like GNAT family acetyltransferase